MCGREGGAVSADVRGEDFIRHSPGSCAESRAAEPAKKSTADA